MALDFGIPYRNEAVRSKG